MAFQSSWFKFSLCTVHIFYGSESGADLKHRIQEIERLVAFLAKRQDAEVRADKKATEARGGRFAPTQVENYILLGDFNVVSPQHETMQALKSKGFKVPDAMDGDAVRREGEHFYDQIAVPVKDERFVVLCHDTNVCRDNRHLDSGYFRCSGNRHQGRDLPARQSHYGRYCGRCDNRIRSGNVRRHRKPPCMPTRSSTT